MIKHCPTCNRSSDKARFVGEFCEFCTIEKVSKSLRGTARIIFCKRCGRIRTPTGYQPLNKETLAAALLKELLNSRCKVWVKEYDDKSATLEILYPVGNDSVSFDKKFSIRMEHEICQDDYRKSSGYYEAVVQLRGERDKVAKMAEKIKKYLELRGAFITKTEVEDFGMDIYTSDKLLTKGFFAMRKLKPKPSYTLYSIKNGKEIYRHTYMLEV